MNDVVPELLDKIETEFKKDVESSDIVLGVLDKIKNKTATYKDANKLSVEIGNILSKSFEKNLQSSLLPDEKMYYNIAERILNKTLGNNYEIISKTCGNIQTILNKNAKLGIKGLIANKNQDRIDGLIEKVVSYDRFDDAKWALKEPIVNFSQSIVNDTIEKNAEFHHKLGLSPKIVRKTTGKCCEWCTNLAGVYNYPDDVPKDVYRVHQRCRCIVEYITADGKTQNVHSKKWRDKDRLGKRKQRIETHKLDVAADKEKNEKRIETLKRNGYNKSVDDIIYDNLKDDEINKFFKEQKSYQDWINGLSEKDKVDIEAYTMSDYEHFNACLRKGDNQFLKDYVENNLIGIDKEDIAFYKDFGEKNGKELISQTKRIEKAIDGYTAEKTFKVYRGTCTNKNYFNDLVVGESKILDKGFLSTSLDKKQAESFLNNGVGEKYMLEITVKKGSKSGAFIADFSDMPEEKEFLFKPSIKFKIKDVKKDEKGINIVEVFAE